jgi:acyl-CoA synthetase (AMP-forming)/AMP-acid ligase II
MSQGTAVLPARFTPKEMNGYLSKYQCSWYSAVPTMHHILFHGKFLKPEELQSLRFVRSCSSSLDPTLCFQLKRFLNVPIIEAYAMTEASHQISSNPLTKQVPGSVGIPSKHSDVQIAIADLKTGALISQPFKQGEICIKGSNILPSGYLNKKDSLSKDYIQGYFRTGDLGMINAEGYLFINGRIKELINRGGEKISPNEVDIVVNSHPDVVNAISFGAPDVQYGEVVAIAVILKQDSSLTLKDLQEYCKDKLARFKIPAKMFIVDDLPKTATGKLQRRIVAQLFQNKL